MNGIENEKDKVKESEFWNLGMGSWMLVLEYVFGGVKPRIRRGSGCEQNLGNLKTYTNLMHAFFYYVLTI